MGELVSVLIPVYQCKRYLEQCVRSVQEQTYDNIEIILVDDGSSDGSGLICDKLANRYDNIVVYHQYNSGVSVARNKALELSHGQYIIFVDSDDYLDTDIISKSIENYKKNNIDLCVFGFQMFSENTFLKYRECIPYDVKTVLTCDELKKDLMKLFSTSVLHAIGTKVYKRNIIEKVNLRFKQEWEYLEDIYFCLSYINACNNNLLFMSRVGYYYRLGNYDSLSHKTIVNSTEPIFETFHLLKNMIGDNYWSCETHKTFYELYDNCISRLRTRGTDAEKQADKFRSMFIVMNMWMNNYLCGRTTELFLKDRHYCKIAIYGMNYMGKTLLDELRNSSIKVEYAIDRNADNIHLPLKIYNPSEKLPNVDVIVVTAISVFDEIKEQLHQKGEDNVISLEEIICG